MEATQVKTQQAAQAPQGQKKGPAFRLPKKKKKWIVRGAVLLAVLAAVYWFFLRPGGNAGAAGQGAYTPAQAQRQDLTVSVSGTGTLEPLESYKVGALVSGDIL